ncbi:hypothetical protein HMPREF9015_01975, partial [Leptotrichia wadei F0279]
KKKKKKASFFQKFLYIFSQKFSLIIIFIQNYKLVKLQYLQYNIREIYNI